MQGRARPRVSGVRKGGRCTGPGLGLGLGLLVRRGRRLGGLLGLLGQLLGLLALGARLG